MAGSFASTPHEAEAAGGGRATRPARPLFPCRRIIPTSESRDRIYAPSLGGAVRSMSLASTADRSLASSVGSTTAMRTDGA